VCVCVCVASPSSALSGDALHCTRLWKGYGKGSSFGLVAFKALSYTSCQGGERELWVAAWARGDSVLGSMVLLTSLWSSVG
jgi:hypothetical protein